MRWHSYLYMNLIMWCPVSSGCLLSCCCFCYCRLSIFLAVVFVYASRWQLEVHWCYFYLYCALVIVIVIYCYINFVGIRRSDARMEPSIYLNGTVVPFNHPDCFKSGMALDRFHSVHDLPKLSLPKPRILLAHYLQFGNAIVWSLGFVWWRVLSDILQTL